MKLDHGKMRGKRGSVIFLSLWKCGRRGMVFNEINLAIVTIIEMFEILCCHFFSLMAKWIKQLSLEWSLQNVPGR